MTTYRDLEDRVITAGGMLQVTVEQLRELEGAGKLGAHVRDAIRHNLHQRGLATLEGAIPNDQRATLWLISAKTQWGAMLLDVVREIRNSPRRAA